MRACALVHRRRERIAAELPEIGEPVVAEIVVFLIDAPINACFPETLCVGRPFERFERGRVVRGIRSLVGLFRWIVDGGGAVVAGGQSTCASEQEQAVWSCWPEYRAMKRVADRERVSKRVI